MGRLAGFRYRNIIIKLKILGKIVAKTHLELFNIICPS